ncbi:DUF6152 family protein [Paucibacter sp. Y2R2-4]|uniref:DUF6152 family protein n=1 Tax=Paucibacter sp. Y2R2-4 TaxID=2893553 RepID=UPI0021E496B7|nr:DUF6152 family protein [Paucibacter sp. Y2R2-4]MCV2348306.1 DUF6152 family protein [Paucibacter sp. Y2R2-4]
MNLFRPQLLNRRIGAGLALAGLALLCNTPVNAHHAFAAEFDGDQPVELKGQVTKITWVNPHSWLYVDVKDAKGQVTNWGFEFGAPFSLQQKGLSKSSLPPGTEVAIKGFRSKNGKPFAYASVVTLGDGRTFQTGGAPDVPAVP